MDLTQAIFGRRSIREFREDPLDPAQVQQLLEAAFAGPIGTREECRYFVVLSGEAKRRLTDEVLEPGLARLDDVLSECAAEETIRYTRSLIPPLRQAPVVIAAYMELVEQEESLALPTLAAAVQNLLLAAYERGLGTCWMTGANYLAEEISEFLGIERKQLVALIPLGRPATEPKRRPRPVHVSWGVSDARSAAPAGAERLPDWLPRHESNEQWEILVVDDRASVRKRICQMLLDAGYRVREADSWENMVALVREQPPSLVILDAFLADYRVADVAQALGGAVEGYLPVLVTAATYHLEDKARALAMGADGFIAKPIRWPDLLGQVASVLRTKHLYDQLAAARDELRELMHHRRQLTDMIVHDLRSPLSGIIGTLEYVSEDESSKLDESARELLETSLASGRQLLGMVNDLLDISKMSAVGLPLDLEEVRVSDVCADAIHQVARLAAEKDIELGCDVPDDLPAITADREKLQRVLVNLLGNGIKFTPAQGQVGIAASADGDGESVEIAVHDTGIGIPKADWERIFDLFWQVKRKERVQGTGLGLAFCKMTVESHGGTISVWSEEGKGSTFTVRLPIAGPPDAVEE